MSSYSQIKDFFNPKDSYGNEWFLNGGFNKNIFFNLVIARARRSGFRGSFRKNAFIALIKVNKDLTDNLNGNSVYDYLIVFKSATNTTNNCDSYLTTNYDTTSRTPILVSYFIGENITSAVINGTQYLPSGSFGTELYQNIFSVDLIEQKSERGSWIVLNDGFQIGLESTTICGY